MEGQATPELVDQVQKLHARLFKLKDDMHAHVSTDKFKLFGPTLHDLRVGQSFMQPIGLPPLTAKERANTQNQYDRLLQLHADIKSRFANPLQVPVGKDKSLKLTISIVEMECITLSSMFGLQLATEQRNLFPEICDNMK